jgi:putative ABC transport system ATP-binding protein
MGRSFATASGEVAALADLDTHFDRGTLHVIVGPTGSGKSTLLRILAATDQPTTGRLLVDGRDITRMGARARRGLRRRVIGFVRQRPGANLLPYLTVVEHLDLAARLRHGGRAADADELLERLGLTHRRDHRPGQLSGGEQQRLAYAAAVTGGPEVVIADEPTAELDHESAAGLLIAVRGLRDLGTCLILSSHDPAVLPHADRVIHLEHGRGDPRTDAGQAGTASPPQWTRPAPRMPARIWRPPDGSSLGRSAGTGNERTGDVPSSLEAGPAVRRTTSTDAARPHRERPPTPPSSPDRSVPEPVIRLREVSKAYRRGGEEVHALSGVSLVVHPGEVVGLVGPSGSGKTTLLNLVCGWEEPDEGEITGSAMPTGGDAGGPEGPTGWAEVAIVAQGLGLSPELTVRENVALARRLSGAAAPDGDGVDGRLADVGLTDLAERYPDETSLGEQQRTAVARALALDPLLVLADEPTAHQDAEHADLLLAALRDRAGAGGACIVATHDAHLLPRLDRVLRLHDGRLVDHQPLDDEPTVGSG